MKEEEKNKAKEIEKIKKWLPRGYGKVIRERTGKSVAFIYQVVCGGSYNDDVYKALLDLALENKREIEEREKLLSTL